ncbi:MAG: hypothetical protein ACFFEF_14395 [Candidatus Thorarchaeota archaeon]
MTKDEEKELAESQKLSKRDKKEIQDGACVNCALITILFMIAGIITMVI